MGSWKGRVIGFLIGFFLFGGLLGGLIGLICGYLWIDRPARRRQQSFSQASSAFTSEANYNQELVYLTFALMGYVARGAGRVNEQHIRTARHYMDDVMGLNPEPRRLAVEAFNYGKSERVDLNDIITRVKRVAGGNLELLSILLEIQVQMALSDAQLEETERERLLEIAVLLGISREAMDRLISQRYSEMRFRYYSGSGDFNAGGGFQGDGREYGYQERRGQGSGGEEYGYRERRSSGRGGDSGSAGAENALEQAYRLLGVESTATLEEISKAHKRLMLKYHPDRLKAQNLSPELMKLYEEKAKAIQAAYDLIKKSRGS